MTAPTPRGEQSPARPDLAALRVAAEAATKAEDAVIAASGQHREDLWTANHDAERAFHDEANPQAILALLSELDALRAREAQPDKITLTMDEARELLAAMDLALGAAGEMADEQQDQLMHEAAQTINAAITALGQKIDDDAPAPASQPDVIEAAEDFVANHPSGLDDDPTFVALRAALKETK